jgi:hypothetical protein
MSELRQPVAIEYITLVPQNAVEAVKLRCSALSGHPTNSNLNSNFLDWPVWYRQAEHLAEAICGLPTHRQ